MNVFEPPDSICALYAAQEIGMIGRRTSGRVGKTTSGGMIGKILDETLALK